MQDLRKEETNIVAGMMVLDIDNSATKSEHITYSRNSVLVDGKSPSFRSNEPSNFECITLPYKFIGNVKLPDDRHLVFSTDGEESEIGIADLKTCQYETLKNDSCLNFSPNHPIQGRAKTLPNGNVITTFIDDFNPVRRINLNKIPLTYSLKNDVCKTKEYTNRLSCDEILLFKHISPPTATYRKTIGGNLKNGMYSILFSYSVQNQKFSDYYVLATPISINNEFTAGSITISLSDVDREFDEFQIVVVADVDGTRTAKSVGTFSTHQTSITISEFDNSEFLPVPIPTLVVNKNVYEKAGIISGNQQYLMLANLTTRTPLNYQKQAFNITSKYVVKQTPLEYYKDGDYIGYWRDEVYSYTISWMYDTGDFSEEFHIPGRIATGDDIALASGADVYETSFSNPPDKIFKWQVENTADSIVIQNNPFDNNQRILGDGKMAYWESTELYPDDPFYFGENACLPIRHHKFPNEEKCPRYSVINGKTYINILSIQFDNIPHPVDENGNRIHNIIGYRILRNERDRSVISRGLANKARFYNDELADKEVLYASYPYGSLKEDPFLSLKQTVFKGKKETNYKPLTEYKNNILNYYSPHGYFDLKYKLGNEIIFETEEIADVKGSFQPVHNHPKFKLLTQAAFWTATIFGIIEAIFEASGQRGKTTTSSSTTGKAEITTSLTGSLGGITGGSISLNSTPGSSNVNFGASASSPSGVTTSSTSTTTNSALSIASGQVVEALNTIQGIIGGNISGFAAVIKALRSVISLITAAGAAAVLFTVEALTIANNVIKIIQDFLSPIEYVYQYNSVATYNSYKPIAKGNKRRITTRQPFYIPSDNVAIDDVIFNNFGKQSSAYLELNKDIKDLTTDDTSLNTISGFKVCGVPRNNINSKTASYYTTTKIPNPNAYGQLRNMRLLATHSSVIKIEESKKYSSPIIFGGDCIIASFSIITKQPLFTQDLADTNFRDEIEFDYRLYPNIAYPRYWIDSSKYDFSSLLHNTVINYSKFTRTTTAKYNLDCKFQDGGNVFRVDSSYMYTSVNGIMDFICEVDYNVWYREKTTVPFYSKTSADVNTILRSDNLKKQEEFKLNESYKHLTLKEIGYRIPTYNQDDLLPTNLNNSLIYSLPSFQSLQTIDNWQYFLPANFFTFDTTDFGNLKAIHKLDQDRVIFLFDKSSPFISYGRDELQLDESGRKIVIGDGGLFAQQPRELIPTDVNYASCQSKYAFSATQFGYLYPSASQGRIFNFTSNLDDVSRNGAKFWCQEYMPIQLYEYFPEYKEEENPLNGVGYLTIVDSTLETYYITKRDFIPKYIDEITYSPSNKKFYYKSTEIQLRDSRYFKDVSWTLSYNPPNKGFVAFHDWHPDWTIQTENKFFTVENNLILKHNNRCDSFCNFNGVDYPYTEEWCVNTGKQTNILSSIELISEAFIYKNKCRDKSLTSSFFDQLEVYNNEQNSGKISLILGDDNKIQSQIYPIQKSTHIESLYFNKENKFRINQFADVTIDDNPFHIHVNDENGYTRIYNPKAINTLKPAHEQKLMRATANKIRLTKNISGNVKIITKFNSSNLINSPR